MSGDKYTIKQKKIKAKNAEIYLSSLIKSI